MSRDSETALRDEIRRYADREAFIPPELDIVRRKVARRSRSRAAAAIIGALVLVVGVVVPVALLSSLEGPGNKSYVGNDDEPPTVESGRAVVTDRLHVAPSPNAVVVGLGSVWVAAPRNDGTGEGDVLRIDPASAEIEARIPVDHLPGWDWGSAGMAIGLGDVWVTDTEGAWGGDASAGCCTAVVQRIDAETNVVQQTLDAGPGYGLDVWVDAGDVWVLRGDPQGGEMSVVRIEATSGEILAEIPIPLTWSQTLFVSAGDVWAFGNHGGGDTLVRIDPRTASVADLIESGDCRPIPAGDTFWFDTGQGYGRFDPETRQVGQIREMPPCGSETPLSDGLGGYWILDTRGAEKEYRHLRPDGQVDRIIEAGGDPGLSGGLHMAYDPVTDTFWFAQHEDFVIRVAIEADAVPSDPAQPSASAGTRTATCRDWLRAVLSEVGAPTGDDLTDWKVEDAESTYLHLVPPDEGFEVWIFAEEPDLVNIEIDTIPVVGRADGFTLHASHVMDVWQLTAESDDVWVTAHIDPPEFAPSDEPALDWLRGLADYATRHPAPPCDP